ncbi:hypothetical protein D9M70_606630 [compost metagenome]
MPRFAPVARTVSFRKPDVLRVANPPVMCIVRMIFADEKKQVTIRRDCWPQFGKFGVDVKAEVFDLNDRTSAYDILLLFF